MLFLVNLWMSHFKLAYNKLCATLGPHALVSQMIEPGIEIGLGVVNDPQFGPLVMLASGGVLVEILKERTVALVPIGHR